MEYDTENISHVPVLLSDRQLKITENGENSWISCLMGQTEPCPQASALIFSRMIYKKGLIRGENQRAVFMKGTKLVYLYLKIIQKFKGQNSVTK